MTQRNPFAPAVRQGISLRVLLMGLSGSGKTYTALALACHLAAETGAKVAVVDTEDGSASKYAGEACQCAECRGHGIVFTFDQMRLERHAPADWLEAMQAATSYGYGVVVLDSITHEWEACLRDVDARQRKMKNKHAAWGETTDAHNQFLAGIRSWSGHVIACCRAKEKHSSEGGKVVSLGVQPVQRDGIEYEFDIACFMSGAQSSIVKTRASSLTGRLDQRPGRALAAAMLAWANGPQAATDTHDEPTVAPAPPAIDLTGSIPRGKKKGTPWRKADRATLLAIVEAGNESERAHASAVLAEIDSGEPAPGTKKKRDTLAEWRSRQAVMWARVLDQVAHEMGDAAADMNADDLEAEARRWVIDALPDDRARDFDVATPTEVREALRHPDLDEVKAALEEAFAAEAQA